MRNWGGENKKVEGDFDALHKRFKELIAWVKEEDKKSYAGKNEKTLGKYYNDRLREGRKIATQLKKFPQKYKVRKINYFAGFVL